MLSGHKGAVLDLHWSRDSRVLFSASADATLAIWDTETGQRIRRHLGHEQIVNGTDVSRRGEEMVVSASDDGYIGVRLSCEYHGRRRLTRTLAVGPASEGSSRFHRDRIPRHSRCIIRGRERALLWWHRQRHTRLGLAKEERRIRSQGSHGHHNLSSSVT